MEVEETWMTIIHILECHPMSNDIICLIMWLYQTRYHTYSKLTELASGVTSHLERTP